VVSALGLVLLLAGGCFLARSSDRPASILPGRTVPAATVPAGNPVEARPVPWVVEPAVRFERADRRDTPKRPRPHPARGIPRRIVAPRLGVDAPVTGVAAAPGGVLVPPDDPTVLGWWRDGARPGAVRGAALIAGHTVSSGGGAFDDLETLRVGDRVTVRTGRGAIGYRVTGVTVYRKAALTRDAERVFSQSIPGRLVLITCEEWDGSRYLSNAVVFADPV
jgi:LPXTG-site transpeptidase (sortase) family protein